MSIIKKIILLIVSLFLGLYSIFAQSENPVISAIQNEVDRNKSELKMEGVASPFFISYSIQDRYEYRLSASLGSISSYSEYHNRRGIPTLLVGDYLRNNLNLGGVQNNSYPSSASLYENTPGIAVTIWNDLDKAYKTAVERYKTKIAVLQQRTQTKEEQELPDFEKVQPVNIILQPLQIDFNKSYWENFLRKASEIAKQFPDILTSDVSLYAYNIMTYTYNTEGSRYAVPSTFYKLTFTANTRTDDGQELNHTIYEENSTIEQMPDIETFISQCKTMINELLQLKNAPVIDEAYSGPVLFEGISVERIFRQAFSFYNTLCASPKMIQPNSNTQNRNSESGNDFELMLNKKVISRSITIKSITGQEYYKGQKLNGYYPVDGEGVVPDKELILIENGVLRNLLNGRMPTKKINHSNGHVRYDLTNNNFRVLPGNLLITSNQTFSNEELRKKLLNAAKEEDLEYAYIVRQYDFWAQFNFIYKIYVADGREELVRGAIISDAANLKNFKRILGTSNNEQFLSFLDIKTTIIHPDAILFEEMDITRATNIEFKKPYLVPKPN